MVSGCSWSASPCDVMNHIAGWSHGWGVLWGRWWSIHWAFDHLLSLGVHVEPRRRPLNFQNGEHSTYGPYVDLHLLAACVSLGNNPVYADSVEMYRRYAKDGVPVCYRCHNLMYE